MNIILSTLYGKLLPEPFLDAFITTNYKKQDSRSVKLDNTYIIVKMKRQSGRVDSRI